MRKRKIKHYFTDESGSGLVLTLLVLLVLSVLGISIGTVTIGSFRLSDANRDDTSAYYIAEAGATIAFEEFGSQVLAAYENSQTEESFFNEVEAIRRMVESKSIDDFRDQSGVKPTATIEIKATGEGNPRKYTIISTGKISNKNRSVQKDIDVNWIEKESGGGLPQIPANVTLVSKGESEFNNGTLKGDIYTDSIEKKSIKVTGDPTFKDSKLFYSNKSKVDDLLSYPDWFKEKLPGLVIQTSTVDWAAYNHLLEDIAVPTVSDKLSPENINQAEKVLDSRGNLTITSGGVTGNKYELKLSSSVKIPNLKIKNNIPVDINVGNSNITILVENLEVETGKLEIIGDGKLTLFVTDSISIKDNSAFNTKGTSEQLTLVYIGDGKVSMGGWSNPVINANIILKKADVSGNSTKINGVLVTGGKNVDLYGGTSDSNLMLIAPNARVSLSGSYSIYGTVVANTFVMSGDTKLIYKEIDTSGFPFGSSAGGNDGEKEIIKDGPIIEQE